MRYWNLYLEHGPTLLFAVPSPAMQDRLLDDFEFVDGPFKSIRAAREAAAQYDDDFAARQGKEARDGRLAV